MGLFTITWLMGLVAVYLGLSRKLQRHNPVCYILLLHSYLPGSDTVEPPALVIVDDNHEYNMVALTAHQ